jgi:dienelactone hydrolase
VRALHLCLDVDMRIPVGVIMALLVIGSLTACTTASPAKTLADGGSGRIAFQSVTVTTQEFLRGVDSGPPVVITGDLQLPPGSTGPLPAIVLVHGSAGLTPTVRRWKDALLTLGVATFALDSFSGRGIRETFTDQSRLSHFAMVVDAYRALTLLATHPRTDLTRIGIMGFSKGGQVTLSASVVRFQRMVGVPGVEFAAYIALYPPCNFRWIGDDQVSKQPIRIFHGEADDQAPFAACRDYIEQLRQSGRDAEMTGYLGAHHGFDAVEAGIPRKIHERQNYSRCFVDEANLPPDITAYLRSCRSMGVTMGYDPRAHTDASQRLMAFLTSAFRLTR